MENNHKQRIYEQSEFLAQLHGVASRYQNTTMRIISLIEPVARRLSHLEEYDGLESINKVIANCYEMLKLSFCLCEFDIVNGESVTLLSKRVYLNEYLDSTFQALQIMLSSTDYSLKYKLCDDNIYIELDDEYLSRALFLVIANACETSPKDSDITISLKKSSDNAVITVSDCGDGVSLEILQSMFDHSIDINILDYDNASISIPLAKKIVELMGGNMLISSKPGEGTIVIITLPIEENGTGLVEFKSSTKKYIVNRYSDMHVIFSGICEPTFF